MGKIITLTPIHPLLIERPQLEPEMPTNCLEQIKKVVRKIRTVEQQLSNISGHPSCTTTRNLKKMKQATTQDIARIQMCMGLLWAQCKKH
jgi:hypothetical protein